MFKRGDIVRRIGDEDNELFVVVKTTAKIIKEYNIMGKPKWGKDPSKMVIREESGRAEMVVPKADYEHFMTRKNIKPFSFLD
jgi:hypothetical protein